MTFKIFNDVFQQAKEAGVSSLCQKKFVNLKQMEDTFPS